MSLEKEKIVLLTQVGNKFGDIPESAREKIAFASDGKCYVNESLLEDNDVIQLLELFKATGDLKEVIPESSADIKARYSSNDKAMTNTSIVQKQIKGLFDRCVQMDGSDLHIMVRDTEAILKVRALGDLERIEQYNADKGNAICRTIYTTMCDVADRNFQPKRAQNARISALHLPDVLSGARVATTPTENGYYMVCRLLYKPKDKNPTLEQLGYEYFHIDDLNRLKSKTSGVTIISGPTGSGKSTTLQVVISSLISDADGKSHVITVEDPPEYVIFGWETQITQHRNSENVIISREVLDDDGNVVLNEKGEKVFSDFVSKKIKCYATQTPVSNAKGRDARSEKFNEAISAAMRLDPDVIMIGEVRDSSSASAAIQAALTGHQVFTTIHANSALTIFSRLLDIGAKKELACDAAVIVGLIAQRLIKKLCVHCSVDIMNNLPEIEKDEKKLETFKRLLVAFGWYAKYEDVKNIENINDLLNNSKSENKIDLSGVRTRNPSGCEKCGNKGIAGRSVVAEIIMTDDTYMELAAQDKKAELRNYWMGKLRGVDMLMHGLLKVKKCISDPFELEKELGYIELYHSTDLPYLFKLLRDTEFYNCEKLLSDGLYATDYKDKFPDLFNNYVEPPPVIEIKKPGRKKKGE